MQIGCEVQYPVKLQMQEYLSDEKRQSVALNNESTTYTLTAVILHSGSGAQAGHYTMLRSVAKDDVR
jgi:uncharacterized UBP type Zn finger protein